jgi:hypothetical protein
MKPIEYANYKEVLDVVTRTNVEDSYQDLMAKESEVLDTVNNVVKYYRDRDIHESEFVNQDISRILQRFPEVWKETIEGLAKVSSYAELLNVVTAKDHVIYLGITFIVLALFLFFIESSKW